MEEEKREILLGKLLDEDILYRDEDDFKLHLDFFKESYPDDYKKFKSIPKRFIEELEIEFKDEYEKEINIRIEGLDRTRLISLVREHDIGRIRKFRGIIKRISKVMPRTKIIKYECMNCGTIIEIQQEGKRKRRPKKCTCGKSSGFRELGKKRVNIQEMKLEELPQDNPEKKPQQIRVYLEGDLTDESMARRLRAGRRVNLIGIVRELPKFMQKNDRELNISEFIIEAINIKSMESDIDIENISDEDIKQIKKIASSKPVDTLADNLAKNIYGHNEIKKAICLQMVKGVEKNRAGERIRNDIHIILVGDSGTGKSVLLENTKARVPRARFVTGKRVTGAGISCMVVKDELNGTWGLEAGAMVLSSGSLVCVDEMGRVPENHMPEFLEPMSSGTVSVSKAGIEATLPARVGILGAANPEHGNFDITEPLASQIDIDTNVLDRFDLIFVIRDKQNEKIERKAVDKVFDKHRSEEESIPDISPELFKKYISYAKKLKPKLKEELRDDLKDTYIELRKLTRESDEEALPINLRSVEGLIRISEASAKLHLREEVTKKDLTIATNILKYSLRQVGLTKEGTLDMSRLIQEFPESERGKIKKVKSFIKLLENQIGKMVPKIELLEKCKEVGIDGDELDKYINKLKQEGEIFEPTNESVQRI